MALLLQHFEVVSHHRSGTDAAPVLDVTHCRRVTVFLFEAGYEIKDFLLSLGKFSHASTSSGALFLRPTLVRLEGEAVLSP
jgi:hypothetical protein